MRRLKLFSGISTVAIAGAFALTACGSEGEGEGAEGASADTRPGMSSEGEGESAASEGEGEGEGEGAVAADSAASFISSLLMIEGHLRAGVALFEAGEPAAASTHMKHPGDEIYRNVESKLSELGQTGLAASMEALGASVEGGESAEAVAKAFAEARADVRSALSASAPTVRDALLGVARLVSIAGEEYEVAFDENGAVVMVHEYQDAFGFTSTAIDYLTTLDGATEAERDAVAKALEYARTAHAATPTIMPDASVTPSSAEIYGAAANIEIAALGL